MKEMAKTGLSESWLSQAVKHLECYKGGLCSSFDLGMACTWFCFVACFFLELG